MSRGPGFSLCVITRGTDGERAAVARALEVERAREIAVLLRDREQSVPTLRPRAEALRALTRARGARLLVHTHAELASEVDADGLHLASDPGPEAAAARAPGCRLGVSCHDARQLADAARMGADYAFLSPFAAVPDKGSPLGDAGFSQLVRGARLPVIALGGIDATNAAFAVRAGAQGAAVIRAVVGAEDPYGACRALLAALSHARSGD